MSLSGVQKVIAMDLIFLQKTVAFRAIVDKDSLEALLLALDKYEWWGKEQAISSLSSR